MIKDKYACRHTFLFGFRGSGPGGWGGLVGAVRPLFVTTGWTDSTKELKKLKNSKNFLTKSLQIFAYLQTEGPVASNTRKMEHVFKFL